MRKLRYILLDVFTNQPFGGNQLGVFLNGRGISSEIMQRIAKELNLSEVTFILPPQDPANHYQVRIFTPTKELPMAGHPTIGTAYTMVREKLVDTSGSQTLIRMEEGVGLIPVTVNLKDGQPVMAKMQQLAPTFNTQTPSVAQIAAALSLEVSDLDDRYPPEIISCGKPFFIIPIKSLTAIKKIKLRLDLYDALVQGLEADEIFVFTTETERPGSTVHSRMFAPTLGIMEDPATGAASGPLGCYLVKYGIASGDQIISEQGFEMGRESFIHIEITQTNGQIDGVFVGGECVFMGEGYLEV